MSSIRSVFFGCLGVTMVITLGDWTDKAEMWHSGLCLLNKAILTDVKRKAALKKSHQEVLNWGAQSLKQHRTRSVTEDEGKQTLCLYARKMESDTRVQNQLQLSDAHLKKLHKTTACVHTDVSIFCGSPGFASTHRGIRLLWSTCTDLHLVMCWLVLDPEHPEPLELMRN